MKKIILLMVLTTISLTILAQTPQAFKYQTVVRDNAGDILVNQNVSFQISILEGSTSGTAVYVETHDTITNEFGLVNLEIGNGAEVSGVFADIDWGGDIYFLQIEMDENGGATYQLMGTSQLLSVPYSLYSESTGDTTRWKKNNDNLYFNSGNVGIGTSNPTSTLDIRGDSQDNGAWLQVGNSDHSHSLSFFPGRENDPNPFIQWKEGDPLRFSTDEGGWSEKMRITGDGNVGIGTTSPLTKLDVAGVITATGGNSTNWNTAYDWGDHSTAGYLNAESDPQVGIIITGKWCVGDGAQINAIADPPVLVEVDPKIGTISNNMVPKWDGTKLVSGTIYNGGYVGIGTTSPTHILHVTGIARSAQSTWATSSDARVKENIHKIEGSLAVIEQLRPVSYNYKNDYVRDNQAMAGMQRGFVAQEVKEVLPEMVTTCTESFAGKTIKDFHLLNTSDLTPFLVAAMQEQQELIRKLERRIEELEKK